MRLDDVIHRVPIDDLVPFEGNPRIGDVGAIADSLTANGQYRPLVVRRETREILGGNHTWRAAKHLGWMTVAVSYVEDLTDEEAKRIVLADNRYSDLATYDPQALAAMLTGLTDLNGTGYAPSDLDALLASLTVLAEPTALTDPDDVPEAPATAQSRLGDVWTLGPHRLLVGDATGDLAPLMQGDIADLVLTDPPYNINYQGGTKDKLTIENDKLLNVDFRALLDGAMTSLARHSAPGAGFYVFHSDSERVNFQQALESAGWLVKQNLIWVKNSLVLSRQDYHWQHEPILYGWLAGAAHNWETDRKQATIIDHQQDFAKMPKAELVALLEGIYSTSDAIRYDRPTRSLDHPTMKPVGLLQYLLCNSTQTGDIVLDPFGGSGSTLIACHGERRKARLVELDPKYADVILRRYMEHTGVTPTNQSGEPFRG